MKVANTSFGRGETVETEPEVSEMPPQRQRERAPGVYKEVSTVVNGVRVFLRVRRDNRLDISFNNGKPRFFSRDEALDFLCGLNRLVDDTFNNLY